MSRELKLSEDYLKELLDYVGSSTVGKVMKRHEILGDRTDMVKLATKELIYEGFRELRDLIIAHDKGRNITIFKFKKNPLTQEQK